MKSSPDALSRLESLLGRLLIVGVLISAAILTVGLALWLAHPGGFTAVWLLNAGLVVLMATPIMRVCVSFAEYVRIRDWLFAATTIVVLMELTVTVVVALIHR